jgi:hypothetical protein
MCFLDVNKKLLKQNQKDYNNGNFPEISYFAPQGWKVQEVFVFQNEKETLIKWRKGLDWDLPSDTPYRFIDENVVFSTYGLKLLLSGTFPYSAGCLALRQDFALTAPFRIQIVASFTNCMFFPALWIFHVQGTWREYDLMECQNGKNLFGTVHTKTAMSKTNDYLRISGGDTLMYEIEVLPDVVNWYVNSRLVKSETKWLPEDAKFIIIFNSGSEKFAECPAVMNVSFLRILHKM